MLWCTICSARLWAHFRWLLISCVQFDQEYRFLKKDHKYFAMLFTFKTSFKMLQFSKPERGKSWFLFHKIKCDSLISGHNYLKSQADWGWVSTVDDFPKQLSHTRTGAWPQPRSGTGFLLVEHASQTPPPQARQWCLVSPSAKRRRHDWHAWKRV